MAVSQLQDARHRTDISHQPTGGGSTISNRQATPAQYPPNFSSTHILYFLNLLDANLIARDDGQRIVNDFSSIFLIAIATGKSQSQKI
jgi:hypothetical protein